MRRFLAVCLLMLSLSGLACGRGKPLKVLYWNIQNGMWSDQGNNYDNFVDYVKGIDPDICVWCEAESRYVTGTDAKLKMPEEQYLPWNWDVLAERYGHKYALIAGKRDTFPQVISSKYPIRIVKRITGNGDDIVVAHGSGWAKVDLGKGKELNIVTVHTWPHKYGFRAEDRKASGERQEGDEFRATEIKYICSQTIATVPGAEKQYWMMTGDFNSLSSVDNYIYKRDPADKCFLVHDYIRANTPYIDSIERLYPGEFKKSTQSGRRIDFMYLTPALFDRVVSADHLYDGFAASVRVEQFKHFCNNSDHYPILITLSL